MREKERIERILTLINKLWSKYPDSRFFQLVSWLESDYSKKNRNVGRRDLVEKDQFGVESYYPLIDLFYLEDSDFEEYLIELVRKTVE